MFLRKQVNDGNKLITMIILENSIGECFVIFVNSIRAVYGPTLRGPKFLSQNCSYCAVIVNGVCFGDVFNTKRSGVSAVCL